MFSFIKDSIIPVVSLNNGVQIYEDGLGTSDKPYKVANTKSTGGCKKIIKYTCRNESEQLSDIIQYINGFCPGDGWNVLEEGHTTCRG